MASKRFEESCIFCKIVAGQIPSKQVYSDDDVLAFHDVNPAAPVHVLIIPKEHIPTINDLQASDAEIMGKLMLAARKVASQLGLAESGYRLILNCGPDALQSVFHIHMHLVGGQKMGWPPFPGDAQAH
ncbi:histidine triad (HIT) protein [Chloroherpeton thalassium ATCC 35110]|uniref:Histidine triad (HIT) protein n=1 Tax=Chloroherpeton thalassium (strain ATCC 35110 / GB-78) TaxID=517418 RepID=B3QWQ5_CHLT3|nr:histidine triad nucleotide-binding protein [Chloroherpeton thalassium]ACF13269.1 histidine triad (HIT) protein [Chloroherpeton thalassium ATCC 35110]